MPALTAGAGVGSLVNFADRAGVNAIQTAESADKVKYKVLKAGRDFVEQSMV
jgi:hypothetical protein